MKKYLLILGFIALISCKKSTPEPPQVEQPKNVVTIDGNVYNTVDIGTQVWTSKGYGSGGVGAAVYKDGSWAYTIDRMKQIVPPAGWRIPNKSDVEKLFKFAGATGSWVSLTESYAEGSAGNITVTDNGTQFKADNSAAIKLMAGNEWEFISASNSLGFNAVPLDNKQAEFWCTDEGLTTFVFYTSASEKAVGVIKQLPNINKQGSKYLFKRAGVRFVKDK